MPIGTPTGIVDAAPVPILLDQINVDNAIANIIDTEENEKVSPKPTDPSGDQTDVNNSTTPEETDSTSKNVPDLNPRPTSASATQGSLQIKTHALKKRQTGIASTSVQCLEKPGPLCNK